VPIRPEEKARYPADWPEISRRIREREGQKCKWCGAPNGATILRDKKDPRKFKVHPVGSCCLGGDPDCKGAVKVVLTVAHLDHTPENCADDNLVALCQRCHLTYDAKHHASTARETRERASGQRRLF
jgi:hypothetical protein